MLVYENSLVNSFVMLELLSAASVLIVFGVCLVIRRLFHRKSLSGFTALITDGDSDLSQELAKQLSQHHNCQVILVCKRNNENNKNHINTEPSGISTVYCNILDNYDLRQLNKTIHESFNGTDILIDNGSSKKPLENSSENCQVFVQATGDKCRSTINLLMHFIPKMKYSVCGHFVTIQSGSHRSASEQSELNQLITLLSGDDQSTFLSNSFKSNKIRLTTVLWDRQRSDEKSLETYSSDDSQNTNLPHDSSSIKSISARILESVCADQKILHIKSKDKSLIQSVFSVK